MPFMVRTESIKPLSTRRSIKIQNCGCVIYAKTFRRSAEGARCTKSPAVEVIPCKWCSVYKFLDIEIAGTAYQYVDARAF